MHGLNPELRRLEMADTVWVGYFLLDLCGLNAIDCG